ncbi:MAG TPA: terminase family protein [Candidatus Micrarchaeaceae archaeon]|nr:terminase family protein [Candidatus Micrarchaeaceae archaeon]
MSRLLRHLAGGLDPVILARNIGMECDPWQAKVLRDPHKRELLVVHRQGGKSTVAAVAAVHCALYDPGALVLVVSPSQRQSVELFRVMLALYRSLGRPVPPEAENALSVILENGSRVVALPADATTIRGYSACRLLIVDEAAFVPDDTIAAVRPMLAVSNGRMLAMSTPFGRRGWFWEASESREWRRTTVTADNCPRISKAFLEAERAALGDWRYRQEYLCEFTDLAGRMFASADLEAIFEAGRLGAVPPGALFTGLTEPARLEVIDAPMPLHPEVGQCPDPTFDHHHAWRDGRCLACGVVVGEPLGVAQ